MNLPTIPLATIEMPKPRKVLVLPEGNMLVYNERFQRLLWSRHNLSEVEANHAREARMRQAEQELEEYVSGWLVAA
ncbi:MAG: hypothetical protein AAFP81_01000 [Pseudomonadota bacterium]